MEPAPVSEMKELAEATENPDWLDMGEAWVPVKTKDKTSDTDSGGVDRWSAYGCDAPLDLRIFGSRVGILTYQNSD